MQGIAPLHPPTPPDVPFSVSGGWSHPRLFRASYRAFLSGFRRRWDLISALPACRAPPVGLPCRVRGASPRPVSGGSCDPADESTIGPVRLLRSFAPPALSGFFATMTSADFSKALTLEISPSKVLHLSPRAARLYLVRLDGVRVSLLLASSPPAPGLAAGSCSCGRGFAFRFLQLHLAATPCGSARVGPITSLGIFHPLDTAHVGRTSGDFLVADQGGRGDGVPTLHFPAAASGSDKEEQATRKSPPNGRQECRPSRMPLLIHQRNGQGVNWNEYRRASLMRKRRRTGWPASELTSNRPFQLAATFR